MDEELRRQVDELISRALREWGREAPLHPRFTLEYLEVRDQWRLSVEAPGRNNHFHCIIDSRAVRGALLGRPHGLVAWVLERACEALWEERWRQGREELDGAYAQAIQAMVGIPDAARGAWEEAREQFYALPRYRVAPDLRIDEADLRPGSIIAVDPGVRDITTVFWQERPVFCGASTWPDEKAEARAEALLRSRLSPIQLKEWTKRKNFHVVGSSGTSYIIECGRAGNIRELTNKGRMIRRWCVVPEGEFLALGDILLAQKIALETDEPGTIEVANLMNGPPRGAVPPGAAITGAAITAGWIDEAAALLNAPAPRWRWPSWL